MARFLAAVAGDPRKRAQTAEDTAEAQAAARKAYGRPTLARLVGEKVVASVKDWLALPAAGGGARQQSAISGGSGFRHEGLDLVRDDAGRPVWNMANAIELLTHHADWQGVLAFNSSRDRREVLRPIPGQAAGAVPRDLGDDDCAAALAWFNRNGFPGATMTVRVPAMRAACRARIYDSLTDHLDRLRGWDGVPRVGGWLVSYCGAADNPYTREVGRRWLIAAMTRAYRPGCKADGMPVLEGEQGKRKSTAARILAGEALFGDALPPMGSKDASSYLRGKWIVEVAELEAMRREADTVKAFLSRQREDFRRAYGREEEAFDRRCVLIGTTNKDDWHRDETGGRRFWPVRVGVIDIDALGRDRDQLWAEARQLFRGGEKWWLSGAIETAAATEIAERAPDDPRVSIITEALTRRQEVATRQLLTEIGVDGSAMDLKAAKRAAAILNGLGRHGCGRFSGGPFKGQTRFTRAVKTGEQ